MHAHPAATAHAHGADLARVIGVHVQPYPGGIRDASSFQAIVSQQPDHHLLHAAQVPADVGAKLFQVEDGITHHLTWTVVGNVAAPIGAEKLYASLLLLGLIDEQVLGLAAFAQGIDVRVLTEEQVVLGVDLVRLGLGARR